MNSSELPPPGEAGPVAGDPGGPGVDPGVPGGLVPGVDPGAGADPTDPDDPGADPGADPDPDPASDPCAGVACGAGGKCTDGVCVCTPGFRLDADGACTPDVDGGLEGRSKEQVCERWVSERQTVHPEWIGDDADECALGEVPGDAQDNAIRRVNLFRWLVGVEPVGLDEGLIGQEQECATLMAAMGGLSHHPPSDAPCWTEPASAAAGSSNLAYGSGLADSVDLYVGDTGVPSLGHRRWVLNPSAEYTAFGFRPRSSCMYSFSSGRAHDVELVAWPPPGYVPAAAPNGRWSLQTYGTDVQPTPETTVEVAVDDEDFETLPFDLLPVGYAGQTPVLAFDVPWGAWAAGHSVRVRVRNLAGGDLEYTVHFVGCR